MIKNTVRHCRRSFTNCTVRKKTIAPITEPNPVLDVGTQQRACVNFHAGSSWINLTRTCDQIPYTIPAEHCNRSDTQGSAQDPAPRAPPLRISDRAKHNFQRGRGWPRATACASEHGCRNSDRHLTLHSMSATNNGPERTVMTENTSHFCRPTCSLSQAMQKEAQEDQQHNARGIHSSKWRSSRKGTLPMPGMALLFIPTALGNFNNNTSCTSLIADGRRNSGAQSTEGFYAPNWATLHCSMWAIVCPSSSALQGYISATPANAMRH